MDSQSYPERSQATTTLVSGIVGLFFTILAPFACKFGHDELKAIDEGRLPPEGHNQASAGRILGIIGTVFLAFGLLADFARLGAGDPSLRDQRLIPPPSNPTLVPANRHPPISAHMR